MKKVLFTCLLLLVGAAAFAQQISFQTAPGTISTPLTAVWSIKVPT